MWPSWFWSVQASSSSCDIKIAFTMTLTVNPANTFWTKVLDWLTFYIFLGSHSWVQWILFAVFSPQRSGCVCSRHEPNVDVLKVIDVYWRFLVKIPGVILRTFMLGSQQKSSYNGVNSDANCKTDWLFKMVKSKWNVFCKSWSYDIEIWKYLRCILIFH